MSRAEGLRILIVAPWLPYPPTWGSATRVYQLIRHLATRHEVTVLSYAPPDARDSVVALQQAGATIQTVRRPAIANKRRAQLTSLFSLGSFHSRSLRSAAMQAAIDRVLAEEPFDIIQVEASQMSGFDFGSRSPVLVDEHNIEYELFDRMARAERSPARRLYNRVEFVKFRREEQRCWQRADGCILTSAREEAIVRRQAPGRPTAVAPNGVDVDYFRPAGAAPDPGSIIFTGLMSYRPNVDAAISFVREILPQILRVRPHATFTIVGMNPTEEVRRLAGPNVIVTGGVPDVRPYVARAAVSVVPLRMGSGTRLKVVEGLAMGKAIVSTSLGCEGLTVRDGEHLLVADDPLAFARGVLRLLDDRDLAAAVGRRGRALAETEYDWASVARRLEAFYADLLGTARPAAAATPGRPEVAHPAGRSASLWRRAGHEAAPGDRVAET